MGRVLEALLTFAFALWAATAAGASRQAQDSFQSGRQAFEAQDYATALSGFESAVAQGLTGPAVHFNIGVAAYRLGKWDRAHRAFLECARAPQMADLTHYNLGLVALAKQDTDEAVSWFTRVLEESRQENLRGLARTQLERLPAASPAERNWLAYGSLAAGYDDNVALVANSDVVGVSGIEDSFIELQAAFSAPLSQPWRIDASLFRVDYSDLDPFDQTGLIGGARYLMDRGGWNYEGGVSFAYTTLDAEGFENARTAFLRASSQFTSTLRADFRYRFSDTDGLNDFTGLTGHRQELTARLEQGMPDWQFGYEYRYSDSNYRDDALSVTWHQLAIDARRALSTHWALWAGAQMRRSSYEQSGDEERLELSFELSRVLTARWRCLLRYAYATNDSDIPEFNYDRNRISLAVEAAL